MISLNSDLAIESGPGRGGRAEGLASIPIVLDGTALPLKQDSLRRRRCRKHISSDPQAGTLRIGPPASSLVSEGLANYKCQ